MTTATQDQIAAVMLLHGTPEQQRQVIQQISNIATTITPQENDNRRVTMKLPANEKLKQIAEEYREEFVCGRIDAFELALGISYNLGCEDSAKMIAVLKRLRTEVMLPADIEEEIDAYINDAENGD